MPPEACSKSITFPNPSLTKLAGESVSPLWISVEDTAQSSETQKTSTFRFNKQHYVTRVYRAPKIAQA